MIGIIVTGHGHFADGLLSAVEVIVGKQEKLIAVNFLAGDTSENLHKKIEQAVKEINCPETLILTDISGGTPFNQSVLISNKANCKCKVFSGTNIPVLLEAIFSRACNDINVMAKSLLESEQAKLQLFAEVKREKQVQSAGGI